MLYKLPKISVITVVRNDVQNIEKTLLSVFEQRYAGTVEFIVIDGDSDDGTVGVISSYAQKISYFLSEKDDGVYDAMNKGISVSTGEFVVFLNSGDVFHDNEVLHNMHLYNMGNKVVYGNVSVKYWDGVYVERPNEFFNTHMKFKGIGICHQAIFYPGDVIRSMKYDLSYKIASDYDLTYKMWKNNVEFVYKDIIVADYCWGNGISSNPLGLVAVYKENAKVVEQQFHPLFWCKLLLEYYRYIKKKYLSKFLGLSRDFC